MCHNAILKLEVYRPSLKLALHDTEAFLNLPSTPVHLYDGFHPVFKTRAYGIETVVLFFLGDSIFVNVISGIFCGFPILCGMICLNEAFRVVLPLAFHRFCACLHCLFCTFHLPAADRTEIITVFDGIGDYELLLKSTFLFCPSIVTSTFSLIHRFL